MKILGKYSFGMGDRFGHQGLAQLKAITEQIKQRAYHYRDRAWGCKKRS
jgi:hypothetical protein